MRFVNRTKSNTALIETALSGESLYMICTLGGPIGKSRHFRESVNELEIFM